ncbi:4-hydroxybenzoate octaprenyltransferase [Nymphaea thermarum]|nr:4-hydroxybenzoate octaprenyltransferase [Nymphaea thermarum]
MGRGELRREDALRHCLWFVRRGIVGGRKRRLQRWWGQRRRQGRCESKVLGGSLPAAASLPDFRLLSLFGCGAILLRGAGCTINDLLDRDIDTLVERTKSRPIASGILTPFQGLCFLGTQLLLGLGILLQLNNYSLDPAVVLPLYASGVCWTLVYDTIYAHQDKDDDLKVGVKSTALRFGDLTKQWISGFGVASISCLALSGYNAHLGWPFYAFLTAGTGQLVWQIWTVDLSKRLDCNKM